MGATCLFLITDGTHLKKSFQLTIIEECIDLSWQHCYIMLDLKLSGKVNCRSVMGETRGWCSLTRWGSSPQQHSGGCTWGPSARRWRSGCSTDQEPDQGDLRPGQEQWLLYDSQCGAIIVLTIKRGFINFFIKLNWWHFHHSGLPAPVYLSTHFLMQTLSLFLVRSRGA